MLKQMIVGLFALVAVGAATAPAFGQISVNIGLGIPMAPPPMQVEVIPVAPQPGYVFVPGYWGWHHDQHVWIRGRWIAERPGHRWVGERWEQRGPNWHMVPGQWQRVEQGRGERRRDERRRDEREDRGRDRDRR